MPSTSHREWRVLVRSLRSRYPQYRSILRLPESPPILAPDWQSRPISSFTGRQQQCVEIVERIAAAERGQVFSIHGIGGIGKSELAKRVISELAVCGTPVGGFLWVELENFDKEGVWPMLARRLGIHGFSQVDRPEDQLDILREVLAVLRPMVILDGANEPEPTQRAFDAIRGATVLITSRRQQVGLSGWPVELGGLDLQESVELYERVYQAKKGQRGPLPCFLPGERESLTGISSRLAGHPLCIDIVASVSAVAGWSPRATLDHLRHRGFAVIQFEPDQVIDKAERHRAIEKTFELALDQDFSGLGVSRRRTRTFFAASGALAADHFYFEEIRIVFSLYLQDFLERSASAREGKRGGDAILRRIGLAPEEELEEPPLPDATGVAEMRWLLASPEMMQRILDRLALTSIVRAAPNPEGRTVYRFHPLLREYAWGILPGLLTPGIWKAVARWAARKARELYGDVGDQLENFLFTLNLCRERQLGEELEILLLSLMPFLRRQGMWTLARQILETTAEWCKTAREKTLLAKILLQLGDLQIRGHEEEAAQHSLAVARKLAEEQADPASCARIDCLLNGLGVMPVDLRLRRRLENLRFTAGAGLSDLVSAELDQILLELDLDGYPELHATARTALLYGDAPDLKRRALVAALAELQRGRFKEAEQLLDAVEKAQQVLFDAQDDASLQRLRVLLYLVSDNADAARTALARAVEAERRLEQKVPSGITIALLQGLLALVERGFATAGPKFVQAGADDWLLLVSPYLTPGLVPQDRLSTAADRVETMAAVATQKSQAAFAQAALAVFEMHCKPGENLRARKRLEAAYAWLRDSGHAVSLFLERLLPLPASAQLDKQTEPEFPESVLPYPTDLPSWVRAKADGRLMKLVPAGLCTLPGSRVWVAPFYIDAHPVTFGDVVAFFEDQHEDSQHALPAAWKKMNPPEDLLAVPATGVSWELAQAWCQGVGKLLPSLVELRRATDVERGDAHAGLSPGEYVEALQAALTKNARSGGGVLRRSAGDLIDELTAEMTPFSSIDELPEWHEGLPEKTTPAMVIGLASAADRPEDRIELERFLELIAASLWMSAEEKEQVLDRVAAYGQEEVAALSPSLAEERMLLGGIPPNSAPFLAHLIRFRAREWRALARHRCGLAPDLLLGPEDKNRFRTLNPYDFLPSFETAFPPGFDLAKHLDPGLSMVERASAREFLELFSKSLQLTPEGKTEILKRLTGSTDDLDASLFGRLRLERREVAEDRPSFVRHLWFLAERWEEWKHLAGELVAACRGGAILFQGKISLLRSTVEFDNPYRPGSILPWFAADDEIEPDAESIVPGGRLPPEQLAQFLADLRSTISLTIDEKDRLLDGLPRLSGFQIDSLSTIFAEERRKFFQLDWFYIPNLQELFEAGQREWHELQEHRTLGSTNPFSSDEIWESHCREPVKLDDLFPSGRLESAGERRVLIGLVLDRLWRSLYYRPEEKRDLVVSLPDRTKEELQSLLETLIKEEDEHLRRDRSQLRILHMWIERCRKEWAALIEDLTGSQARGLPLLSRPNEPPSPARQCLAERVFGSRADRASATEFLDLLGSNLGLETKEKEDLLSRLGFCPLADLDELARVLRAEHKAYLSLTVDEFPDLARRIDEAWRRWADLLEGPALEGHRRDGQELGASGPRMPARPGDTGFMDILETLSVLACHPLAGQPPCDLGLPAELDIRDLLGEHPETPFPERLFLQLLSACPSLGRENKLMFLQRVPALSQGEVLDLIQDLLQERERLATLPEPHWLELRYRCELAWEDWRWILFSSMPKLVRARLLRIPHIRMLLEDRRRPHDENVDGIDFAVHLPEGADPQNPFTRARPCDVMLPPEIDVREILPAHPDCLFSERGFLDLLSNSISLDREEKGRILESIPRLSRTQIRELIRILLEERDQFLHLPSDHTSDLRHLAALHRSEWADLVFSLQPSLRCVAYLLGVVDPNSGLSHLDGRLWHWTSSTQGGQGNHAVLGSIDQELDASTGREGVLDLAHFGLPDGAERRLLGFRGCVPIFSHKDLEALIPVDAPPQRDGRSKDGAGSPGSSV